MSHLLIHAASWVVGFVFGLLLGLYMGERARRLDAHVREGQIPVPQRDVKPRSKRVTIQDEMTPEEYEEHLEAREARFNRIVEDAMKEGLSREDARRDAEMILAELEQKLGTPL